MASSKTFLLLGLVFTVFILIFSEVSAREQAETANQLEKSGGNDQEERDRDGTRYGGGGNHEGKEHGSSCDIHKRSCQAAGGHGSNNHGGKGGSHERDPNKRYGGGGSHVGGEHGSPCHDIHKRNCGKAGAEHGPHNHRGEAGGSHARGEHSPYNGGGKDKSHERGEHGSYKGGGGGKGNTGRSVRPGGPGSVDESETEN